MRIIKQGEIPITEKRMTCTHCNTIFVYDKNDVQHDQRGDHSVICPLCKQWIDEKLGIPEK